MQVTLSSKGQLVLPAPVRRQLGLKAKSRLTLETREDGLFLRPVKSPARIAPIPYLAPGSIRLTAHDYTLDHLAGEDDVPSA